MAVFGDSHAYYLFPGLAGQNAGHGINTLVIGETGCAPLSSVRSFLKGTPEQCSSANETAIQLLASDRTVRTVVLASLGPYYFSGTSFAADYVGVNDAANWVLQPASGRSASSKAELFQEGFSRTIARLQAAGKEVVFFIDIPELDFHPESCLDVRPFRLSPRPQVACGVALERVLERQAVYRSIIGNLTKTHSRLHVFDPLPYLCANRLCGVERNGRLLYRDSHHLSLFGSGYVAGEFDKWLRAIRASG